MNFNEPSVRWHCFIAPAFFDRIVQVITHVSLVPRTIVEITTAS